MKNPFRDRQLFWRKAHRQPVKAQADQRLRTTPLFEGWLGTPGLGNPPVRQPSREMQAREGGHEAPSTAVPHSNAAASTVDTSPVEAVPLASPLVRTFKLWRWPLIWLAMLAVFSGMGTAALIWLTSLPPPINCTKVADLTIDMDRMYCAEQAARSGELPKLVAGVEMLKQWPDEHPLHAEAERLINKWSDQILVIAREKVKQSDLKGALNAISHIPKTSPVYKEAREAVARWQKVWKRGETINAKAQAALKKQQWNVASEQMALMTEMDNEYWSFQRASALAEQIGVEKRAWQALMEARRLVVEDGTAKELVTAITVALKVPPKTYAMEAAKQDIKRWSQALVTQSIQQWQQGNTVGAAEMLQLPADVTRIPEIQDLILFGGAYRLVSNVSSRWLPEPAHLWRLMEAIAAIQQVKSDSPFYQQAQTHLSSWKGQLQDTVQLQYASFTASLGQRSTYQLAIGEADHIAADRPRYKQAQTLIAYWTDQVERIEDQPLLLRAKDLAKSGQIADLKKAIAQASKIQLGRALRLEAQNWIATWRDQIERIEDQPFLNQAWALADQGKLDDAIAAALNINPGRSLYDEAQDAIADWRAKQVRDAQIAQDQPILDRAYSLADNGDLSAAIDVASGIDPGRALYGEAQDAIARWSRQRDAILNPPPAAPPIDQESNPFPNGASPTPTPMMPGTFPFGSPLPSPSPSPNASGTGLPSKIELLPPSPSPQTSPSNNSNRPTMPPSNPPISTPESQPAPPEPIPAPAPTNPEPSTRRSPFEGYYDNRYYQQRQNN